MSGRAHCPECGGAMTEGTVADYRRGAVHPSEWVEGRVESSFWTGKLRNEERYEITAVARPRRGDPGRARDARLRPA